MASGPPALEQIAGNVLLHESGGAQGPDVLADALIRAVAKLQEPLNNLVGRKGVSALINRAVHLARRDHPILTAVVHDGESSEVLTGLAQALQSQSPADAAAACEAVLVQLLGLLVGLLGDDLGLRPVHTIWPDTTLTLQSFPGSMKVEQ